MPTLSATDISRMDAPARVGEALNRSLNYASPEMKGVIRGFISPQSIALISGTLLLWVGSHLFGIGEIVDVLLLAVGVFTLGFSVFDGAAALADFADHAIHARTDADFDTAGKSFAHAAVVLGLSTLQAILLHGAGRAAIARGRPQVRPRTTVSDPPANPGKLNLTRPQEIPTKVPNTIVRGTTNAYGLIKIARNQSMSEQRLALLHELVHRFFSPRSGPFLKLRAEMNMSAYNRFALLRYLEEAMAQGWAELQLNGLAAAIDALHFPLINGYVTVSQLVVEGMAVGTIVVGGATLRVTITHDAPDSE